MVERCRQRNQIHGTYTADAVDNVHGSTFAWTVTMEYIYQDAGISNKFHTYTTGKEACGWIWGHILRVCNIDDRLTKP